MNDFEDVMGKFAIGFLGFLVLVVLPFGLLTAGPSDHQQQVRKDVAAKIEACAKDGGYPVFTQDKDGELNAFLACATVPPPTMP